jgi:hypothetical protein
MRSWPRSPEGRRLPVPERTFSPGERIAIDISFVREGGAEIESVEAVFAREGSD